MLVESAEWFLSGLCQRDVWVIMRQEDLVQPHDSLTALLPPPLASVLAAGLALLQFLAGNTMLQRRLNLALRPAPCASRSHRRCGCVSVSGLALGYVVEPLLGVVRKFGVVIDSLKPWRLLRHWWNLR